MKMKSLYLKLLSIVLILSAVMFLFTTGLGYANAASNENTEIFEMNDGASVYVGSIDDDMTGIRFQAVLSKKSFENFTKNVSDPVYFGVEISANGKSPVDICYLVDDATKQTAMENDIIFATGEYEYTYNADITYNKVLLKSELEAKLNKTLTEDELNAYLNKAYGTQLTAKSYYKIGDKGQKNYGTNSIERSMWGIASYFVSVEPDEYAQLAKKYFSDVAESVNAKITLESGAINYSFDETSRVYCDAKLVTLDDGKLPLSLLSNRKEGDVLRLNVVSSDGVLTTVNATVESSSKVISEQAFYDAQADKIYYTQSGVTKTLNGSGNGSFSYVVDSSTSYPLATYTGDTFKSNVNYKYADSVLFYNGEDYTNNKPHLGYMMYGLAPKINHENGSVVVNIGYNPQTDVYTGVAISATIDGVSYKFENVVIISQMIDNAKELDDVFNKPDTTTSDYVFKASSGGYIKSYGTISKGVYMLANDITVSTDANANPEDKFTFDNSEWNYFEGVFDGRGYNIINLDVSGQENNPGNGLFSATSVYSVIQNVGFKNVKANYGSVFQGNMFDYRYSPTRMHPTYYMTDGTKTYANGEYNGSGLGSKYYRNQLVDESDTTTTIGELLKSGNRGANFYRGQGGYFSNVFVEVDPSTQRLMGVISRNMVNSVNTVRAYNMVIEYKPTNLYDSAEGANDGALPYGYAYTNGEYGVLFGGAYERSSRTGSGAEWQLTSVANTQPTYYPTCMDNMTYFVPNTTANTGGALKTEGALLFSALGDSRVSDRVYQTTKVYVISTVGLVSCASGYILGTNETIDSSNIYQFVSKDSYYKNDAHTTLRGLYTRLERHTSYEAAALYAGEFKTKGDLTSYCQASTGTCEAKYWDISKGYLDWKR